MTTTAQTIFDNHSDNYTGMTEAATRQAVDDEQDWANEITILQFADGSCLRFCGVDQSAEIIADDSVSVTHA